LPSSNAAQGQLQAMQKKYGPFTATSGGDDNLAQLYGEQGNDVGRALLKQAIAISSSRWGWIPP